MEGSYHPTSEATGDFLLGEASLPEKRDALRRYLTGRGVGDSGQSALFEHTKDACVLVEDDSAITTSRIGGSPLLPAGAEWPLGPGDRPLQFIAKLELSELPYVGPLGDGTLSFWWDFAFFEEDDATWPLLAAAIHIEPGAETYEPDPHPGLEEWQIVEGVAWLRGVPMPIAGEAERVVSASGPDSDRLIEAMNGLDEALPRCKHHLLGATLDIQGPVLDELQYGFEEGSLQRLAERYEPDERTRGAWSLLAQFDSGQATDFGDAGTLYFLMATSDLEAKRFDRVLAIMQCG